MPLTPNFTTSQQAGLPSNVIITDASTGSDVAIVSRRVFLVNYAGEYLVADGTTTNYTVWPLAQSSISIDCLSADTAVQITVNWVDAGGVTLYTKTSLAGFTLFNMTFYYSLTQGQAAISQPSCGGRRRNISDLSHMIANQLAQQGQLAYTGLETDGNFGLFHLNVHQDFLI